MELLIISSTTKINKILQTVALNETKIYLIDQILKKHNAYGKTKFNSNILLFM